MTKQKLIIFALIFFLGFQSNTMKAQGNDYFGFNFIGKNTKKSIYDFELKSNLIIIKLFIDQSDTLNFVLDTGVRGIIIIDTTLKRSLNILHPRPIKVQGFGSDEVYKATVSSGHTIQFGRIEGISQNLIIMDEDLVNLSDFIGTTIHGIIGSELFKRFNIKINYTNNRLTFSEPDRFHYRKRMGKKLDLHFKQSKPYIKIPGISSDNINYDSLSLLIDTGGAHALLLEKETISPEIMPEVMVGANIGRGLNGKIDGELGRINYFDLAGVKFEDVVTTFPSDVTFNADHDSIVRHGSIGSEILKRFTVTFNYHQKLMVLKPLKHQLKKPFQSDMSGLELKLGKDKDFVVTDVMANSVASKSGIRTGDRILFINNIPSSKLSINEAYLEFRKKKGLMTKLLIKRNDKIIWCYFKLSPII